jgi:hypothetical protein
MKAQSLSQRLNLAVVGITLATLVLSLISIAVGYGLLFEFAPKLVSAEDAILPAPVEWGMYSVCIVLGSIAASVVATRVARRMVEPLGPSDDLGFPESFGCDSRLLFGGGVGRRSSSGRPMGSYRAVRAWRSQG